MTVETKQRLSLAPDPRPEVNTESKSATAVLGEQKAISEDHQVDIQVGMALDRMTKTEGWRYLKVFLEKQYSAEAFLNCPENQFQETRWKGLAFQAVTKWVEQAIRRAEHLISKQEKKEKGEKDNG